MAGKKGRHERSSVHGGRPVTQLALELRCRSSKLSLIRSLVEVSAKRNIAQQGGGMSNSGDYGRGTIHSPRGVSIQLSQNKRLVKKCIVDIGWIQDVGLTRRLHIEGALFFMAMGWHLRKEWSFC
jgi:hypothetical protein